MKQRKATASLPPVPARRHPDAIPHAITRHRASARHLAAMGLISSLLALFGCDQQKVDQAMKQAGDKARAAWNTIKPDSQLFQGIQPGVSTEAELREQAGRPDIVWEEEDGSRRLEYPRGPEGATTWMVSIGADGKVAKIEQVLTAENFARVRPGMSRDAVRRLLGKPTKVEAFALKKEEVWGYRWWKQPQEKAFFNVHFDQGSGLVTTTSRSDDPARVQGG